MTRLGEKYMEELNISIRRGSSDEERVRYITQLSESEKKTMDDYRRVLSLMNNDTHAISEMHFIRSSFNPFPLSFRRQKMRDVIEKRLNFSSDRMSRLVDMFMNRESPDNSHSVKHREFVKERHDSLNNSPTRGDYIFSDVDFTSFSWER